MKRIAIPISKGVLSEYFGQCNHYQFFDIDNGSLTREGLSVPHQSNKLELPQWAAEKGITDIITHKVDKQIINEFSKYKINVYVGMPMVAADELINMYQKGNLVSDGDIIKSILL